MYKLLTQKENMDYQQFGRRKISTGYEVIIPRKVFIPSIRTILRKLFLSHRALDSWKRLPQTVVDADTMQTFKSRYDRFIQDMGN